MDVIFAIMLIYFTVTVNWNERKSFPKTFPYFFTAFLMAFIFYKLLIILGVDIVQIVKDKKIIESFFGKLGIN